MWDRDDLTACLSAGRIEWRKHVLARMMERGISRSAVVHVLRSGDIIESYPRDQPVPSALLHVDGPPALHVVVAVDSTSPTCFVVTAYRPDTDHFEPDLRTRRAR